MSSWQGKVGCRYILILRNPMSLCFFLHVHIFLLSIFLSWPLCLQLLSYHLPHLILILVMSVFLSLPSNFQVSHTASMVCGQGEALWAPFLFHTSGFSQSRRERPFEYFSKIACKILICAKKSLHTRNIEFSIYVIYFDTEKITIKRKVNSWTFLEMPKTKALPLSRGRGWQGKWMVICLIRGVM